MKILALYNLLAVTACAGLGYLVYLEMEQPVPSLPPVFTPTEATEPVATPAPKAVFRMPQKTAFNQLAMRPPFSPTRRPPRPKPPEPVVQQPQPAAPQPKLAEPQIRLVGILINPQKSFAMVRKPDAAELLRLAKGQDLEGWRVESVLPDRLLLSHQGTILEFELREAARKKAGASTAR